MKIELLKELTEKTAPSGEEGSVRALILRETEKYADEVYTDALGNLIVHKKGSGKKVMAAAHMDEIGVIATFVDKKGFVRFAPIGGLEVKYLVHRRIRFQNGTVGVIGLEEDTEKPTAAKMYIDIGADGEADAQARVQLGDTAVFDGGFYTEGDRIISKALDNRAGCFVMIEALKQLKNTNNDVYLVFTVQEEVGLRGAKTSAFGIDPDYAVAIDVTDTGDTPESGKMAVSMGKGAAVKVMDHSVLCHHEVRNALIELAKELGISYQLEIMTDGGTDAGAIHLTKSGIKTGGISIPTRYIHSPAEMCSVSDLEACVKLLRAFLERDR